MADEEEGYFDGSSEATVLISDSSGQFTISFVLTDGAWDDPLVVAYYRGIGQRLADEEFGRPLVVEFLDEYLEAQKAITIR